MTDVRFYHLTRSSLEGALPVMLEKTLERGQRAVVLAGSAERVEALNAHLWTYRDHSFLPHGSAKDGQAADQPIWLTDRDENPNGAEVLFLTDGAQSESLASYAVCALLFDGSNDGALAAARKQWKALKDGGHEVTYWQQDERGRWSKQS
ncbi:MAG: DNA polymerase III subunit chi [Kiloniellales bacterium]|nr:DNA polymerase III subunit chi [Kiloniellales bacterium]